MEKNLNFLDRNEFNYSPSKEVVEALKNFDINKLCFYTRIYDEGKKSILSVFLSELYDIDETQVLLGYGGGDILKQAVHYFLTQEDGNKTMLIPKFSWWYYKSIADEVNGHTLQYPLYEDGNTFKYDFETLKDMIQKENPKILLLASPNNPTGNGLTPKELDELLAEVPSQTVVLIDEAYASFVSTDTSYIKKLVNKYQNLIISRTLSKFYGLPGLRMGFGFMSKELENFSRYSNKYLGYNRISEDIAIAAPGLSPGISHPTCNPACAPFTPSNSGQRLPPTYYRGCWHVVSRGLFVRYRLLLVPDKRSLQPESLLPSRGVAGSGLRPLPNIPHCCLP